MPENARQTALSILQKVQKENAYANLELTRELTASSLSNADKALTTEIVYGVLRWQGRLDYILNYFLKRPLASLPSVIVQILRLGLYQMMFMDRIPVPAAINEAVKLAHKYGHRGTAGLVNGVLRRIDREKDAVKMPDLEKDPAGYISVFYSHPRWLVEYWLAYWGLDATMALCRFDNLPAPFEARINTLKITVQDFFYKMAGAGITVHGDARLPEGFEAAGGSVALLKPFLAAGLATVQHFSSQLAALALGPVPGSRVLDACAAPGGKTTHLAQLMSNRGKIYAMDIHPHKVELIKENCRTLGVDIVEAARGDACYLPGSLADWADYALCDVPCSGLGVLRRRPDARWQKQKQDIKALAAVGYDILSSVSHAVRPGGVLLYSTCTLTQEENEDNVLRFLRENKNWRREAFPVWPADRPPQEEGFCTVLPQRDNWDGFFLARLRRKE